MDLWYVSGRYQLLESMKAHEISIYDSTLWAEKAKFKILFEKRKPLFCLGCISFKKLQKIKWIWFTIIIGEVLFFLLF